MPELVWFPGLPGNPPWMMVDETMARYGGDGQCLECAGYGQPVYIRGAIDSDWRIGHNAFHDGMIPRTEAERMSNVLWCDPGAHAFKAGIPGSQKFAGTEIDDEGIAHTVQMDTCPAHSFSTKMAIDAPRPQDDRPPIPYGNSSDDRPEYGDVSTGYERGNHP